MASTSRSTTLRRQSAPAVTSHLWRTGLIAAVLAAVGGIVIRSIGIAAGAVPADYALLQPARVVGISVLAALVATALLGALARWTRRPLLIFRIIAVAFLVISFSGPLGAGASTGIVATMLLMHVVAAAIIAGGLTWPRRAAQ